MLRTVKEIVNKRLLRQKPTTEEYSRYTEALRNLKDSLRPEETEDYNKAHIVQFLSSTERNILLILRVLLTALFTKPSRIIVLLRLL